MTDFPSYAYGTVTIEADGTVITGTDVIWSGVNARAGDDIKVDGHMVDIVDVIDETHLKIDAWPYDAVTAAEYKIVQRSPLRFVGGVARADLTQLLATLKAKGLLWYLPDGLTEPDDAKPPLTADEGQGILDIATKHLWVMSGGAWVSAGSFSGFGAPKDYNAGTTYHPLDIVISDGTVYLVKADTTGHAPPNSTYYSLIAQAGAAATVDVGTTITLAPGASATVTPGGTSNARILNFGIPTGKGYGGTSTTSLTIGIGSKTFAIQTGLAYEAGNRVHIGATANQSNWMEGFVSAYDAGTGSMTVAVSDVGGAGTIASWGIGLTGKPGLGDGDMKGAANLAELTDTEVAQNNLGASTVGKGLFTAPSAAAARGTLGARTVGGALFTSASAADAHTAMRQSVRVITGADTIVASDIGKTLIFNSTSAFTVAITAAAALGNGFWCRFKNVNVGLVTLDPNSSEVIDALATSIVPKFDSGMLICDGTAFQTVERPAGVLLGSGVFSATSTLNLTLPAGFAEFEINLSDLRPSTASAVLGRISANSGSSYETGYYTSWWRNTAQTPAISANGLTAQSYMRVPATIQTGSSGASVKLVFQNAVGANSYFKMFGVVQSFDSSSEHQLVHFQNWLSTFNSYNFLQFFPESGNWASGNWQMVGKRKMN